LPAVLRRQLKQLAQRSNGKEFRIFLPEALKTLRETKSPMLRRSIQFE
jgi:hypothetical protein